MRFILIAFMAIIGAALAADKAPPAPPAPPAPHAPHAPHPPPAPPAPVIPAGHPCKADGSAGNCASGFCLQLVQDNEGVCK